MRSDLIHARHSVSGLIQRSGFLKLPGVADNRPAKGPGGSKSHTLSTLCEVYPREQPPADPINMPVTGGREHPEQATPTAWSPGYRQMPRLPGSSEPLPSLQEEPCEKYLTIEDVRV